MPQDLMRRRASNSAFNNTNVYAHYNTGHSQVAFDYRLEYRNNGDCRETNIYRFNSEADEAEYRYDGDYHFGYAHQNFNLRYLYSLGDSLNFQVKFSPEPAPLVLAHQLGHHDHQ